MTSVNYNASATAALRTLQNTNAQLESTQNRISSGFKIGEAKDNAAYWSISTTLKSDNKSLSTVKDALGLGAATVDVAYEGLNAASDVLDEIKKKLTAATQAGIDRNVIQAEITQLQQQLSSIATSSTFSGENWLSVNSATAGYTTTKNVVSSFNRDNTGNVTIGTIGVDISKVALFDANVAANKDGILDVSVQLKALDGVTDLTYGGSSAAAAGAVAGGINAGGLAVGGTPATAGRASLLGATGFANIGTTEKLIFDNVGDKIAFNITVDGAASATAIEIRRGTVWSALNNTADRIEITNGTDLAKVVQQALRDQGVTGVNVSWEGASGTAGKLKYTSQNPDGTASMVLVASTATADVATATAGDSLSNTAAIGGMFNTAAAGTATYEKAKVTLGKFDTPMQFGTGAAIKFTLKVEGGTGANTKDLVIDKAAVSAALGTTDGRINTAVDFQRVLQSLTSGGTPIPVDVGSAMDGTITFTSRDATSASKVWLVATGVNPLVTQATGTPAASPVTSTMSVDKIDISDDTMKARGATTDGTTTGTLDGEKVRQAINAYIDVVSVALKKVNSAASNLGAVSSRIDLQQTFVNKLMDSIDNGVSGLVDADMSEESTKLQALQTKQQLGVQALSIANSSAQNVLRLFQ